MRKHIPNNLIFSTLILACLGFAVWWMSAHVVWLGDDLDYKYMMKGEIWQSWGWINSWNDFWQSQFTHYRNVNGRFVAHTLVQLFNGILGQHAFAICNALVYMSFTLMIAKTGKVKFTNSSGLLGAACLSVICFVTKMMPTCQIGYIWGMLANLIWLTAFFSSKKPSWGIVLLLSLSGIIVGNWQESVSIGICAALGIWWLSRLPSGYKKTEVCFDWRHSWIMLGYFGGTAINCLCPATLSRVKTVTTPFCDQLAVASYSLTGLLILVILTIVVCLGHKNRISIKFTTHDDSIPDGCLIAATLFLLLFNIIIGIYSNRQLFGVNLFAIVLALRSLPGHKFPVFINISLLATVLTTWIYNYSAIKEVRRQYDEIASIYSRSKDGIVEYDRVRVMDLGHPMDAKYYEDILGQFDNDLHHSLMKDFKHTRKGKTLRLQPATIPDSEKVEQYAPGHFYVTVKEPEKGTPARSVTVYGHYTLMGIINIPSAPHKLQLLKYSRRKKPYATAVVIPEYPLFMADSISL